MKILIKSTKNLSNYYVHAYETWKNALSNYADVVCYGNGYPNFFGWDISDKEVYERIGFVPDVELWCGGPGNKKPQYINNEYILTNSVKSIPKFILLTDFWEIVRDCDIGTWLKREKYLESLGVVGYFSFYSQAKKWMQSIVKSEFNKYVEFPYIYDELFSKHNMKKKWDINIQLCLRNCYPFRVKVASHIFSNAKKDNITYFRINNQGKHEYKDIEGDKDPLNSIFGGSCPSENYAKLVNSCRITLADGYTKYCSQKTKWKLPDEDLFLARYSQVLASSSVLFCPEISSTHIEPIKDGVHYVRIDEGNFYDKIKYYLGNSDELDRISKNANAWAKRNCSFQSVGRLILRQLEKKI